MRLAKAFIAGVGVAYLFDPAQGTRRRRQVLGRVAQLGRLGPRVRRRFTERKDPSSASSILVEDPTVLQLIQRDALGTVGISTDEVEVEVNDGVATLRGSVATASLADDLIQQVSLIPGVRDVAAMLRIGGYSGEPARQ